MVRSWLVQSERRRARPAPRRGFALVLVLGFVAVVMVLGLSFASQTAPSMVQATNRDAIVRARFLAGSGVSIAAHYLIEPPAAVAPWDFWTGTGGGGVSVDGGPDYCTISVSRSAADDRIFTVRSEGFATDPKGAVRARRAVTADLVTPPPHRWYLPDAFRASTSQSFPGKLRFYGDLFVNGNVSTTNAWSQSVVAATGTVTWPNLFTNGPPSARRPLQSPRRVPGIDPNDYVTYTVDGTAYSAMLYDSVDLIASSPPCKGAVVTPTNPGGILVSTNGSVGSRLLRLKNNVNFTGTIVVDGILELDGTNVRIDAVPGYPAIVVSDDLVIKSDGVSMTVNGPMLVGDIMRKDNKGANISITGTFISNGSIDWAPSGSTLDITWDRDRAWFHNFAGINDRQPYTILRWVEN